jgi:hypothetical protein
MECFPKLFAGAIGISGFETGLLRSHGGEASAGRSDPHASARRPCAELCVRLRNQTLLLTLADDAGSLSVGLISLRISVP